ncbi:MAG: ATP-dependent DNA helicase RecG, partial [Rikenellaceae bacterium]
YSTPERIATSMGTKWLYNLITTLWTMLERESIPDPLPQYLRESYNLISLREALFNVHFPQSNELLAAAQFRLKFEDLLPHQLYLQQIRADRHARLEGFVFNRVGDCFNNFYQNLNFPLTGAQKRVIKEIRQDTTSGYQMNRLLQGDVGSGKTVVALAAMLLAVDNGLQSTIMAPTEILARQHYASMVRMTAGLNLRIAILTGSSGSKERREAVEGAASGDIDILVGTHALIEDPVQFKALGFAIIDEQHRFGVEQRARLWNKRDVKPHILVMTATPIPRTLAMTLYGDLDVSIIDELPAGRKPIITSRRTNASRLRVFGFMREQIAAGRQIYVVYPLISESESMDYHNLTEGFEELSRNFPLPKYQIAICHGKMKPADKDEQMRRFKDGEAHIMVATSVIEVGVDVPNATLIIIESAERFGLAQLHQLRGRVGRSDLQSYCILMSGDKLSTTSRKRLEFMVETNDGFRLSEFDLKLRGAGDINGTQQSGESLNLRVANPTRDIEILSLVREVAEKIATTDRELTHPQNAPLRLLVGRVKQGGEHDFSTIS